MLNDTITLFCVFDCYLPVCMMTRDSAQVLQELLKNLIHCFQS